MENTLMNHSKQIFLTIALIIASIAYPAVSSKYLTQYNKNVIREAQNQVNASANYILEQEAQTRKMLTAKSFKKSTFNKIKENAYFPVLKELKTKEAIAKQLKHELKKSRPDSREYEMAKENYTEAKANRKVFEEEAAPNLEEIWSQNIKNAAKQE